MTVLLVFVQYMFQEAELQERAFFLALENIFSMFSKWNVLVIWREYWAELRIF